VIVDIVASSFCVTLTMKYDPQNLELSSSHKLSDKSLALSIIKGLCHLCPILLEGVHKRRLATFVRTISFPPSRRFCSFVFSSPIQTSKFLTTSPYKNVICEQPLIISFPLSFHILYGVIYCQKTNHDLLFYKIFISTFMNKNVHRFSRT
jgi:hypothetical protein